MFGHTRLSYRLHGWELGGGVVWSSEDADRASAPTTNRESRCTVRKGGTWFAKRSPVTNDSDSGFPEARLRVEYLAGSPHDPMRRPCAETLCGDPVRRPYAETLCGDPVRRPCAETLCGDPVRRP
eukprot:3168125-Pyramimonas_sp.AAC.2